MSQSGRHSLHWQKLPVMTLFLFCVIVGLVPNPIIVKGCAVRPLSTSQSQFPHSWFQPLQFNQQQQQSTPQPLVGGGVGVPSASRLIHHSIPTPTLTPTPNSWSSWSQLMTQAAGHLQQFSFNGYNAKSQSQAGTGVIAAKTVLPDPVTIRHHGQPTPRTHEVKNCLPSDPEKNKILVTTFYQQTFGDHNLTNLDSFLHPNLIQHNPKVGDGVKGFATFLHSMTSLHIPARFRTRMTLDFRRVSGVGDLVWVHLRLPLLGRQFAVMDLFRVECGKIAEHWDVVQEITGKVLASSKNAHPFF